MDIKEEMKELGKDVEEDVIVFRMDTNMAEDVFHGLKHLRYTREFGCLTRNERTALMYVLECLDGCINL